MSNSKTRSSKGTFFYGWVIVVACTTLLVILSGIMYSFGVFFKPLAADFGWSRSITSGVYSLFMFTRGILAIPMGWLADRFGPAKVSAFCGLAAGIGLVLTSQINSLWQLYVAYGLLVALGLSSGFAISTGTTARWFVKHRGLALGIVTSGVGLGMLSVIPIAERLVAALDWSRAYFILGITTWIVMITSALFLRRDPEQLGYQPYGLKDREATTDQKERIKKIATPESGTDLRAAVFMRPLWMVVLIYFLFNFSLQMIMVHLVNHATDLRIDPFVASTLLSIVGISSIAGRLIMGIASDRIGSNNALLICCIIVVVSLVWLIFAKQLWMFYLFAVIFGFAYGGEVPQMPALINQFFGLQAVTALLGTVLLGTTFGGALGSWIGGQIFDVMHSYQVAFIIAVIAALFAALITFTLRRTKLTIPSRPQSIVS